MLNYTTYFHFFLQSVGSQGVDSRELWIAYKCLSLQSLLWTFLYAFPHVVGSGSKGLKEIEYLGCFKHLSDKSSQHFSRLSESVNRPVISKAATYLTYMSHNITVKHVFWILSRSVLCWMVSEKWKTTLQYPVQLRLNKSKSVTSKGLRGHLSDQMLDLIRGSNIFHITKGFMNYL